jgi:UDP-3-O-[3-hydroxymyristoyl] N-acetylglucosamine deacetylase/3-hydroxyacyl-[acyl-carrier-protein] dehydratase
VGCDLDNVIIELNASELPIMDGSSKYFVEALEKPELKNKIQNGIFMW